jgi:hypothetical protein
MLSTTFISDLQEELNQRTSEFEMLSDQLALLDVQIDRYDEIIENMDRSVLPLIDEINVAISSVKTAYDNRVAIGCKSDLSWQVVATYERNRVPGPGTYDVVIFGARKNPSVREDYNYWGAKYYRRPHNQDYGANIVKEFVGSIGAGSNNLAVVSAGATLNLLLDDIIVDNINNPLIFSASNPAKIVGFGVSTIITEVVEFGGNISLASTIIVETGVGTTVGINDTEDGPEDTIELSGVLLPGTRVVGFGTTSVFEEVWDDVVGDFISSETSANTLIISQPSVAEVTDGIFKIGISTETPSILLSTTTTFDVSNINFTVIRNTQSESTEFDSTNNSLDPVTIGILNNNSIGYGHTLIRVNNGSPIGPFQWREVLGDFDPEPQCGANFARYFPGNESWPIRTTSVYSTNGFLISSSFEYVGENSTVSSGFGLISRISIGTTSTKPPYFNGAPPSNAVCVSYSSTITAMEASRDAILAKNQPIIDATITASKVLRGLRDKMETQAFALLQAKAWAQTEVNNAKNNLKILQSTNFDPYEPQIYKPSSRFSTTVIGTGITS